MTNKTAPQYPGQGTQPVPPWAKAMCPFLTAGEIARHPDSVIVTPGAQPKPTTAQSCKGPQCMLFVSVKTTTGEMLEGCAPVHQFVLLNSLNQQVGRFIAAAEAGAAAEAAANGKTETPSVPDVMNTPALQAVTDNDSHED